MEPIDDLALRLFVLPRTVPETLARVLERWKDDLWLHAKLLEKSRDHLASRTDVDQVRVHMLNRRLGHLSVDIDMLDELLRQLGVSTATSATTESAVAASVQRQRPVGRSTAARRT